MSTIKSDSEDLTLNAHGSGNDIKFQSNSSEVGSLTAEGVMTTTLFSGSGASLTALPAAQLTGTIADARFPATLPAASAANLTAIPAANITGTLPAISGANLTGVGVDGISSSADATCLTIDSSENITHNSATPKFTIKGTTGVYGLYFKQGNTEYSSLTWDVNTGETKLSNGQNGSGNYLTFCAGDGTERMRIQNDGDVSIGTTSNEGRLHVEHSSNSVALMVNSTKSSSFTDNVMKIQSSQDSANSSYKLLEMRNGGGARLRILDSGNIINSNNSYGQISDERVKQDIADASSQWEDIKALKVRKFKLKREVNKDSATAAYQIGVVAQEMESAGMSKLVTEEAPDKEDVVLHADFGTIDGEGVFTAGERVKAVKYSILYMKAIKALQEAQTRIETLETKVAALES